MSMYDPPNMRKLEDVYPEGTPISIESAEYGGSVDTKYGTRASATVHVLEEVDGDVETREYRVFGALAEAIRRMGDGDLPAVVTIQREGEAKRWRRAEG